MVFGLFGKDKGDRQEKRIAKERGNLAKVHDKYGREAAMQYLIAHQDHPLALKSLLNRFLVNVSPATMDIREKQRVIDVFENAPDKAQSINFLKDFIEEQESISHACQLLRQLSDENVCDYFVDLLCNIGPEYRRDPEKKKILLREIFECQEKDYSERLFCFLEDIDPDVVMLTAEVILANDERDTRKPMLDLLTKEHDSP